MAHIASELPDLSGYIPLQVGAASHPPLPYLKDNTGENISDKNYSYCELTGIYWIYKNILCDQVGICHYRRFFAPSDEARPMFLEEIQDLLKRYDIMIPRSISFSNSIYCQFKSIHTSNSLLVCREVIDKMCPDYISAYDFVMGHSVFTGCNMSVTNFEIFRSYCDWLFPILFQVEEIIKPYTLKSAYNQRIIGFLSERLQQVWLMMQPLKIYEANCYMKI
jgi:hypothetical protein